MGRGQGPSPEDPRRDSARRPQGRAPRRPASATAPCCASSRSDGDKGRYVGRVIKVVGKNKAEIIGVYRAGPDGGRIIPVEKRAQGREIVIPPGEEGTPATATSSASA